MNQALKEADEILKLQDECGFLLKVGDNFGRRIVALCDNGRPLTEGELQTGPAALKEAWSSKASNRLLRIAIYYRLYLLDEVLASDQNLRVPPSQTPEKSLTLAVYDVTEAERGDAQKAAEEALAEAVDVYARRIEEVDPKRAARLRRALKAGCLEADSDDLFIEGEDNWLPWVVAFEMPQQEDFDDHDLTSDAQLDGEDRGFRRSRALGEGIGRGIAAALTDFVTSTRQDYETGEYTDETGEDADRIQAVKPVFEFAKPIVNVYALPTFGEFAFMCVAGTTIVCVVLIGFRLLRLL